MRIAIVGARISGSYAARLLARQGHEVTLYDPTLAGLKPCGGGVTARASLTEWLLRNQVPHNCIRTMKVSVPDGLEAPVPLRFPIRVFCRGELEAALRREAVASGARLIEARVNQIAHKAGGWILQTSGAEETTDYLVGADGANSIVRAAVQGRFRAEDLSLAIGYHLPGSHHPDRVSVAFQEFGFQGYLWSFPSRLYSSVGILRWLPHVHAAELRQRVESYIEAHYSGGLAGATYYAAKIPCLSRRRLFAQRTCGPGWALIGDAAGFADAITAEGIRYAWRSAELLAEAHRCGEPLAYEDAWRADFGKDLGRAAAWKERLYEGSLLRQPFIRRSVQSLRYSSLVRRFTDSLVAGRISYQRLRVAIILCGPIILAQILRNRMQDESCPQPARADHAG